MIGDLRDLRAGGEARADLACDGLNDARGAGAHGQGRQARAAYGEFGRSLPDARFSFGDLRVRLGRIDIEAFTRDRDERS